jgi:glyoxylase-like metal-dependent hydrolase (beta-lactamase superfamily II)
MLKTDLGSKPPRLMGPPLPEALSTSPCPQPGQPLIYAFAPNRETLGGTAYWVAIAEPNGHRTQVMIDSPRWDGANQDWIAAQGGLDWLVITHRGGIGRAQEIQQATGAKLLIQEQEAYLLPGVNCTTFAQEFQITAGVQALWTPGHSPGSTCVHVPTDSGGILFSGRTLLPTPDGTIQPIKTTTTFHWPRQIESLHQLLQRFEPTQLTEIYPGANTGFLYRQSTRQSPVESAEGAHQALSRLDLEALRQTAYK